MATSNNPFISTSMAWRSLPAALLCLTALVFPFSVAATSVTTGGALAFGIFSGQWWQGCRDAWSRYRRLCIAFIAYLALVALGVGWSLDPYWGLHILSREWFWLLIPIGIASFREESWRRRFLLSLSIGLTLHLGFCVLQKFGVVTVTTDGSRAIDATGHIGHIAFGFVYGIWAAWLLHWGLLRGDGWRYVALLLAAWAWTMVFLAMGRSGYMVTLVSSALVMWKHFLSWDRRKRMAGLSIAVLVVCSLALFGSTRESIQRTLSAFSFLEGGEMHQAIHVEERYGLWMIGLKVWQSRPLLGVGTGGYPAAAMKVAEAHPELIHKGRIRQDHPFNIYLLSLSRWGPVGLILMVWLLFEWIRLGWRQDWLQSHVVPFIALTGIALAVHGMTSSSLEEHFSSIFSMLMLTLALSEQRDSLPKG